jgi:OmcA/MtrC family decaheme c-type cytochrome
MLRFLAIAVLFGSALLLSSSDTPVFTSRDKAFYADPDLVAFVRPGLVIRINSASIASDGTIQVQFSVTDPRGLPLDRDGVYTPGSISTSFVAAYIPRGQTNYIAYTKRTQTSPITSVSAVQPAADSGGTYEKTADGQYTYTFGTKAPSGFDMGATTSIGVYASRDLSEFDLGTNSANDVFDFVPDGSPVVDTHEVVRTVTCNKCHDPLSAHGGSRRLVTLCVLCHNPGGGGTQTIDPDTGNSIDAEVLFHKIHMGSSLPSVQTGTPYQIVGFRQSVNDYSTVVFPADPRNCQMCHETGAPPQGGTAPPGSMTPAPAQPPVQGDWWITHPTRVACGSCHDNVNFATGENHANLPQINDNQCANCHFPQGELPFDTSILGAHTIPTFAPGLPGVVFTLVQVDNGVAGSRPTVTFTLDDKSGNPIAPSDMNLLNLVMAGPTADYASVVSESARQATGSGGTYVYTFNTAIPADATGTYTIGIEGYRNITLLPNTVTQQVVRDVGHNEVINFSVDGSTITPHPVEAENANCNACHYSISAHGGIRNEVQYCILCHNPNATDVSRRPAGQLPAQTIDFPVLIHRIHTGEEMESPYIVYGFGGSENDFSEVRFPGDRRDCAKCHVNGSQEVPLPATRIPVQTPRGFYNPMGPTAAACTGCHTAQDAAAHTSVMTSPALGESCSVCHGTGADFSVDKVHARSL